MKLKVSIFVDFPLLKYLQAAIPEIDFQEIKSEIFQETPTAPLVTPAVITSTERGFASTSNVTSETTSAITEQQLSQETIFHAPSTSKIRRTTVKRKAEEQALDTKMMQEALQILHTSVNSAADEQLKEAEIIIADLPMVAPLFNELSKLKWLQLTTAGYDTKPPLVCNKLPFLVTRYSGRHFGQLMSEYVIASIINHERDMFTIYDNQKKCEWFQTDKITNHRCISDLTVGVLGYGTIGEYIGRSLHMLGANILGYGRRVTYKDTNNCLTKYYTKPLLAEFLGKSDYVVNVLPNTSDTAGLLNGNVLENCKEKPTVFINIGRGSIIDDEDLITALNNGWISGAILDVFNIEPLPKSSPLWTMDQVKITPHVAGLTKGEHLAQQFKENLQLYLENKTILTALNAPST